MTGTKTNERPGTKAVLRHSRQSASKARAVLDVIRGMEYARARDVLVHLDRGAAEPIGKLLHSCAANAEHNDGLDPNELYVAACFADEGTTLKRWRPRARGRATRIRKRTCHITVILARMPEEKLARVRAKAAAEQADRRARRVSAGRRREAAAKPPVAEDVAEDPFAIESVEIESVEMESVETEPVEIESVAVPVEVDQASETPAEVAEEENDHDATASAAKDADPSSSDAEKGAN
jgi:large subunit ribosomal protein L22